MDNGPHELRDMQMLASMAIPSRVLVGGLGLGILPIMLAERDDITHVVVVEKDQSVIDLFENTSQKIKVVHGNFFDHLRNLKPYDSVVADIWLDKKSHMTEKEYIKNLPIPSFVWGIDV